MTGYLGYPEGPLDPDELSGDEVGFGIGGGMGERWKRNFALEAEMLFLGRTYDTPPDFLFGKDEVSVTSLVLFVDIRAIVPVWKFEPYAGVGVGPTFSGLEIESTYAPGVAAERRYRFGFAAQWMLGVDLIFTRRSRIGLELRHVELEADFGHVSRGTVDIGGRLMLLTIRIPL